MMTPEDRARALLRELNDAMKSPRGDYYQGDLHDPHRTLHIIERHIRADREEAIRALAEKPDALNL
jgi:hypothetical protein